MTRRLRRTSVALAVVLAAAAVPVLAPAPAQASPGCLRDVARTLVSMDGCDDTTPPNTSITGSVPVVTRAGWANKRTIRIAFAGRHSDADTDAIGFECRLSTSAAVPTEEQWGDCPDNGIYRDLAQSAAAPYVFWVRAYDTADRPVTWDDMIATPFAIDDEPTDDVDPTPARLVFRVDSIVPNTFIFDTPYDPLTPQAPMVTTTSPQVQLTSDEVATYVCSVDRRSVPCAEGTTTLRNLSAGTRTLRVQAVDAAGNIDPSPAVTAFTVPANLRTKAAGWKRKRAGGYLGNDYVLASERGVELAFKARRYRELRLLATTGPKAGVIEVKVGAAWKRVSLRRSTLTQHDQIVVREALSSRRSDTIRIRVVSNGKPVQLDGYLAR